MATILVADEDRLFALTIVHILSQHDHQVIAAAKGQQLLSLLRTWLHR